MLIEDNRLIVVYSDSTRTNVGRIVGKDGKDGKSTTGTIRVEIYRDKSLSKTIPNAKPGGRVRVNVTPRSEN